LGSSIYSGWNVKKRIRYSNRYNTCRYARPKFTLFTEATFKNFTGNEIPDSNEGTEVLFSIGAENREEVDEMAEKVVKAGGTIYAEAEDNDSWMYGCGFADLDGHRWNVLYMDMSKMPME